jgi:serine/threonine protein kinase
VTAISLPLGFLLALALPGVPLAFAISVIGFGLFTSIDLKTGFLRSALGFGATLLIFSYFFQSSIFNPGGASSGNYSFVFAASAPAVAVLLATFMFSKTERYRIPKLNVLATLSTGVALIIGASQGSSSSPIGANLVSSSIFILLGLGSNCVQMIPLFFLDKFWQSRKYSLSVLPTAFFAYNAIVGYDYFTSPTTAQAYTYFSSLAFLPVLTIAAMGASGLALKMIKAPVKAITNQVKPPPMRISLPKINITGDHSIKQGRIETIRIATESEGKTRDMTTIKAELQSPTGKRDPLRVARLSQGRYTINYQTSKPGNFNAQITATDRANQTIKQSFGFTVIAPTPAHSAPSAKQSPPPSRQPVSNPHPTPPPARVQPIPASPPSIIPPAPTPIAPTGAIPKSGLPSLDRWDPKVWVNQEIHGYRVVEHLASGASGYVLRATFGQAGTEVALKVPILRTTIRPRAANEPTAGTITLNETMTEATRLLELSGQSKYVVQIRGILVDRLNIQEIMKGNMTLYYRSPPAIVMEYMKGGTAKRLIEDPEYEPLYYSEKWGGIVVLLGQMMAQALDMIHNAGFVHLDVKPQNVLFTTKPPLTGQEMLDQMLTGTLTPKLADLGSAVRVEGRVIQFTSEYAPGEQVLGEDAQPSMDVYALGASLFTMLTRTPVHSFRLIEVMNNMTAGANAGKAEKELESVWDSFSPDFAKIDTKFSAIIPVLKSMLARDPGRRPEAGSVASSLQKLLDKKGNLS